MPVGSFIIIDCRTVGYAENVDNQSPPGRYNDGKDLFSMSNSPFHASNQIDNEHCWTSQAVARLHALD